MIPSYTLILGNSHDIKIPFATAVVCDPPYGINYKGDKNTDYDLKREAKAYGKTGKHREFKQHVNALSRRQKVFGDAVDFDPQRWLCYDKIAFTGAQHFYHTLPPGGMLHCWNKRRDGWKSLDQADCDIIWVSSNRPVSRTFNQAWSGVIREGDNRYGKGLHPTEKPLALMQWIISLLSLPPGSTVLDPYMGSGTTGVAALSLGYNFVGVEAIQEHYDTATKRLADFNNVMISKGV